MYGKQLPIVYNTSGYERVETVRALADTVDIYLTDLKYAEKTSAKAWSGAPNYPEIARAALEADAAREKAEAARESTEAEQGREIEKQSTKRG